MSRLIEENSAIEVAEKFNFTDASERRKYVDFVRYCVQNSKTAYDVEKVVEEVEELCVTDIDVLQEMTIDIVKAGGV